VSSQSPEQPTLRDHQAARAKYTSLSWQLWREQYQAHFFVRHPLPEEHLAIEVRLFWQGQISHLSGWTDPIGQIASWIQDRIRDLLGWLWSNLIEPGLKALSGALSWILSGIRSVVDSISGALAGVWASISAGVNALGSAISGGLAWLGGELTKATAWIWQQLQGFFSAIGEVLKQIGTWIINAIKTYVIDPILNLLKPIFEALQGLVAGIWNFITGGAMHHSPQEWRGSYLRWFGILSGVTVLALGGIVGATIVDAIHPFRDIRLKEVAQFAYQFTGMGFLQTAFFTTYFDIACSKPVRQELNAVFTPEIPGSGDLIRFVVREVLPPAEFHMAMSLQGFSRFWSEAYWEAHWVLPPTERTRTAFLRKQISEEEYRKFLIWYDFKPEPRPGISKSDVDLMLATQYEWPGAIETRWLIEWGIIAPEEGVELLKAQGTDPKWAPRTMQAILLNQLREELGKVRTVFERRLREGFMKKADFAAALTGINYAPHVINALMKWADEELALDEALDLAKEYTALAKDELITVEQLGNSLRELGMIEDRITRTQKQIERVLAVKAMKAAAKEAAKTAAATP